MVWWLDCRSCGAASRMIRIRHSLQYNCPVWLRSIVTRNGHAGHHSDCGMHGRHHHSSCIALMDAVVIRVVGNGPAQIFES